jgi:hypothetical protein
LVRLAVLTIFVVFLAVEPALAAARKVALVIGNTRYSFQTSLQRAASDSGAIAEELRRLGFTVIRRTNRSKSNLEHDLARFGEVADGSDVALVYYAGHGLQMDGENFLVPTDARLESRDDIDRTLLRLEAVRQRAGRSKLQILLLDVCHNRPVARKIARSADSRDAESQAFAQVRARRNEIIGYSAADCANAQYELGDHSPYAAALLENLGKRDIEIGKLFRIVAAAVEKRTSGRQIPYENARLPAEDIYLSSDDTPANPGDDGRKKQSDVEEAWTLAKASQNPRRIRAFLEEYGSNSPFRRRAERELARLSKLDEDETETKPEPKWEPDTEGGLWTWHERSRPAAAPKRLCDVLASAPEDPLKLPSVSGVLVEELDVGAALNACRDAMAAYPAEPRFVYLYARSLSAEKSYVKAIPFLTRAWEMGYSTAASTLGLYHEFGRGVAVDATLALDWYRQGRRAKNALAVCNMSSLYINGLGSIKPDLQRALGLADECLTMGLSRGYLMKASALSRSSRYQEAAEAMLAGLKSGSKSILHEMLASDDRWPLEFRREIQSALRTQGLYSGSADGRFGDQTKAALQDMYDRSIRN